MGESIPMPTRIDSYAFKSDHKFSLTRMYSSFPVFSFIALHALITSHSSTTPSPTKRIDSRTHKIGSPAAMNNLS